MLSQLVRCASPEWRIKPTSQECRRTDFCVSRVRPRLSGLITREIQNLRFSARSTGPPDCPNHRSLNWGPMCYIRFHCGCEPVLQTENRRFLRFTSETKIFWFDYWGDVGSEVGAYMGCLVWFVYLGNVNSVCGWGDDGIVWFIYSGDVGFVGLNYSGVVGLL